MESSSIMNGLNMINTSNPNRKHREAGDLMPITRLGVGDQVMLGKGKLGEVIGRAAANQDQKGGSTTIRWKGGTVLTYQWDDYGDMKVTLTKPASQVRC